MPAKPSALISLEQTISAITRFMADMEANAFRQEDFSELSMRQVLYLETIARLGHPSFSELAQALGISRPSVTALVGRLMRAGYVHKVQDGDDRRSYHIIPTEKGQRFTDMHQNLHRQVVQSLISRLDEGEVDQLACLLNKAVSE